MIIYTEKYTESKSESKYQCIVQNTPKTRKHFQTKQTVSKLSNKKHKSFQTFDYSYIMYKLHNPHFIFPYILHLYIFCIFICIHVHV